ncbi:ThuA domain-containing protein [Telmatocola sphagniphila]|uniref:ThuA domain-containing protein n=1 Tax=Telmatocola sphagniphila TaxID=1123043 RepID=A0A8E6EW77_9BACT|nr:PVC-type heme-binding CxxCH protein [Telmatocola sphagniphila]QVL33517.1 ThuA domain-containing protein [Telmatocola sphagniphila]
MAKYFLALCCLTFLSLPVWSQGYQPEEALRKMESPKGFQIQLVASEPLIRQPLSISFDERGRLWVLQYLQYPTPAGLKAVQRDEYLRTVWDKVPEPPPFGPKGIDRITILSEPNSQGEFTKSKDFLSDLNICSGFCLGTGGVYVLQSPYLLFYPDKNRDDVPDGPPEVLLKGFGMEDTHSLANNLQWGPDGWLYGAAGSTSTSRVINPARTDSPAIEFQQGIWRYHPRKKIFELFTEGGGNIWGLDFDKYGECIAGTNYGGKAMMHMIPGAYYVKSFSKHGELHNPFAYGYFDHVPYQDFQGGHVTNGGRIYQAERYPQEFRDTYMAGNLLSNVVNWHVMSSDGSSFKARHGGTLLKANDSWFRPVDCRLGPDGCLYVADWYDKRASHLDPIDNWDKTNGRIYRVFYPGSEPKPFDLSKLKSQELVELLENPNKWYRIEAKRILAERQDRSVLPRLKTLALGSEDWKSLESLWMAFQLGGFEDPSWVAQLLGSADPHIRAWTIRLAGEQTNLERTTDLRQIAEKLSSTESNPIVRVQMLQTPNGLDFDIVRMLKSERDQKDPFLPLLYWWRYDRLTNDIAVDTSSDLESLSKFLVWESQIFRDVILPRLARKFLFLAASSERKLKIGIWLLKKAPDAAAIRAILSGFDQAIINEANNSQLNLASALKVLSKNNLYDELLSRLLIKLRDEQAISDLMVKLRAPETKESDRLKFIKLLSLVRDKRIGEVIYSEFLKAKSEGYRVATLQALQKQQNPSFNSMLVEMFPKSQGSIRSVLKGMLLAREDTALQLLVKVDSGELKATEFPMELVKNCALFHSKKVDEIILKHWGRIVPQSAGEKIARIRSLSAAIRKTAGNPMHGKELFTKTCSTCHQIFGEGGKVGPDLTSADRKNLDYMLTQIIDPSAYIRPEYISHTAKLSSGQVLTGLIKDPSPERITLQNIRDNQVLETVISRSDIEELSPSSVSLMPEKLLDTFSEQDAADLLAYLQSTPPAKANTKKLKILLISGSLEYKSDESLVEFKKIVEKEYPWECTLAIRKTDSEILNLKFLKDCDLAIFFTRRLTVEGEQLQLVKDYLKSNKPLIGIRTASHGFQNYLQMDKEILGGDYQGHYGAGPKCEVQITEKGKSHPILLKVQPFSSPGSLYKNPTPAKDIQVLLTGSIPDHKEPVAWIREVNQRRLFYTSLGHPSDFQNPNFRRMLTNAILWVTEK